MHEKIKGGLFLGFGILCLIFLLRFIWSYMYPWPPQALLRINIDRIISAPVDINLRKPGAKFVIADTDLGRVGILGLGNSNAGYVYQSLGTEKQYRSIYSEKIRCYRFFENRFYFFIHTSFRLILLLGFMLFFSYFGIKMLKYEAE